MKSQANRTLAPALSLSIAAAAGHASADTFIGFSHPFSGPGLTEALSISVFEIAPDEPGRVANVTTDADWSADLIVAVTDAPTPGVIDPALNITDANFAAFSIAGKPGPASASFGPAPLHAAHVTVSNLSLDFIDPQVGTTQFFDAGVSRAVANQNGVEATIAGIVTFDMADGSRHTIDLAAQLGTVTIDLQGFYQLEQTDDPSGDILQTFEITPLVSFLLEIDDLDYVFSLEFDNFTLAATDVFTPGDIVPAIPTPGILAAAPALACLAARRRRSDRA